MERNKSALKGHDFNRLISYLKSNDQKELTVIFDIGTKACRVIIAPKSVPPALFGQWDRSTFYNASGYYRLGEDVDPINNELNPRSSKLYSVIKFVQFFRNYLIKHDWVKERDIHVFGTEVFRWLTNQDEILKVFKERTSLDLKVLSEDQESYFSLISLQYTSEFVNDEKISTPKLDDVESVFLIDQGGGSTEVSFYKVNNPSLNKHTSIGKFGTVSLGEIFFRLDSKGYTIDPRVANYPVPQQIDSLNSYIEKGLSEWELFEEPLKSKTVFYGMGSALHNMVRYSNIDSHNRVISLDRIEDKLQSITLKLNSSYSRISDLFHKIEADQLPQEDVNQLTLFYGLPVYAHLLRRFNASEIRLAGFGLRYGIYVYLYATERSSLSDKEISDIPVMVDNSKTEVVDAEKGEDFVRNQWVRFETGIRKQYTEEYDALLSLQRRFNLSKDDVAREGIKEEISKVKDNIDYIQQEWLLKAREMKAEVSGLEEGAVLNELKEIKIAMNERFDSLDGAVFGLTLSVTEICNSINQKDIVGDHKSEQMAAELLSKIEELIENSRIQQKEVVLNQLKGELETSAKLKLTIPLLPGILQYESDLIGFTAKEPIKSWKDLWKILSSSVNT